MYERFTDAAREVMSAAKQEADRLNHEYVGTEHLLIALAESDAHPAGMILRQFGVDAESSRTTVAGIVLPGPDLPPAGLWTKLLARFVIECRRPWTPSIKHVIERAMEATREDHSRTVGTEHLLHGICADDETVAYRALINCGIDMAELQAAVNEARQRTE